MFKFEGGREALSMSKGFSLLELVIVMSVVVLLSSIGVGFYLNYDKSTEVGAVAQTIASNLKQAQSKSMTGEGGFKWGLHFVNSGASTHYYQIFSTPSNYADAGKVIVSTVYLTSGTAFSTPSSGNLDIIFSKISGAYDAVNSTGTSVTIFYSSVSKTISVSAVGNITIS